MRKLIILLLFVTAGCRRITALYESGHPGSSGSVEASAPYVAASLDFVTGHADFEGPYDVVATFPAADFDAFTVENVLMNGEVVPYFSVNNAHVWSRFRNANGRDPLIIHARAAWSPGDAVTLEVRGVSGDREPVVLTISGVAPQPAETVTGIRFLMPDANSPAYRISITIPAAEMEGGRIDYIEANGVECRDYELDQAGRAIYDRRTVRAEALSITARFDWRADQSVDFRVVWEEDVGEWQTAARSGAGSPGWWNDGWRYYAGVLVSETAGLSRHAEPVHLTMGLFADRLRDPAREIRVVAYSPNDVRADDRGYFEVPSQVYNVVTWDDAELLAAEEIDEATGLPIRRYSPTTTVDVAFLADVPSYRSQSYLIFYGNPDAPAPDYQTDLQFEGEGLGATVENSFFRIGHAPNSGAVFTIEVKQGLDVLLEHKLETNGAVQWNPDVYSPPHAWVHASDWENPEHEIVCGPVFCMIRRWAPLPFQEDVLASSTNIYYAGKPYFIVNETTLFEQDRFVKAVRQTEVVFNHEVLDEFAYVDALGAVRGFEIEGSRPHPGHAVELPLETPWMAFLNRDRQVAFAHIPLDGISTNVTGGTPRLEDAYFYVANGPWAYLARALVYPFGSNNASRMVHVPAGAIYTSKTAYAPIRLEEGQDTFRPIQDLRSVLNEPLRARVFHDTDSRTPKEWVVPILTEPFDEGVEGALGNKQNREGGSK